MTWSTTAAAGDDQDAFVDVWDKELRDLLSSLSPG